MTACPHTGVSVPECSCRECIRALIERHMPPPQLAGELAELAEAGGAEVPPLRRRRIVARLRELRQRRAA